MQVLVPQPGIKPVVPALEVWSPNNWTTRKIPKYKCFLRLLIYKAVLRLFVFYSELSRYTPISRTEYLF